MRAIKPFKILDSGCTIGEKNLYKLLCKTLNMCLVLVGVGGFVVLGFFWFLFQQAKLKTFKCTCCLAFTSSIWVVSSAGLLNVGCLLYFMGVSLPLSPLFKIARSTKKELISFLLLWYLMYFRMHVNNCHFRLCTEFTSYGDFVTYTEAGKNVFPMYYYIWVIASFKLLFLLC